MQDSGQYVRSFWGPPWHPGAQEKPSGGGWAEIEACPKGSWQVTVGGAAWLVSGLAQSKKELNIQQGARIIALQQLPSLLPGSSAQQSFPMKPDMQTWLCGQP